MMANTNNLEIEAVVFEKHDPEDGDYYWIYGVSDIFEAIAMGLHTAGVSYFRLDQLPIQLTEEVMTQGKIQKGSELGSDEIGNILTLPWGLLPKQ